MNALTQATNALKTAHVGLAHAQAALTTAKRNLVEHETELVFNGLQGKNEAARKAELDMVTRTERLAVNDAEDALRAAQLAFTLADLDHKLAREITALRRAELNAQGGDNA